MIEKITLTNPFLIPILCKVSNQFYNIKIPLNQLGKLYIEKMTK